MIRSAGRAPRSRTTRRSASSTLLAENNDASASTASPLAGNQTPMSDMQRWYRDSRVLLWRNPEPPQSAQKRNTRSLLWDNSAKMKGSPERKPKTTRRRRIGRQPPYSSSSCRAHNQGHTSTPETGPPREDTGSWTISSSQQSFPSDPSPRPRSETAGRDDEATNLDAIRAFLAPFDANNELGEWEFSVEKGRWWRQNKTTNAIIWAPTADMFS